MSAPNPAGPAAAGAAARWGDLRNRALSALAMLALGATAIWWGGALFGAVAVLVTGLMIWELSAMTAPGRKVEAVLMGLLAGGLLAAELWSHSVFLMPLLVVPSILGALRPRQHRIVFAAYAFAVMLAGYGLVALRATEGVGAITWIVAVVVVSDVAGYFAGRAIGGPKFWPAVSPKKTWSGTIAGWIGAALVGLAFVGVGGGWGLVWLSPLMSFAGQMGDIAESWIKRRAGIKDSSHLIPGHGGAMDRFDAMIGAVLMLLLAAQFGQLPLTNG